MIADCIVLGSSMKILKDSLMVEYLKSKHLELTDQEKNEFIKNSNKKFIHFTSKESAQKIMDSGFLIPTKGVLANHFTRNLDYNGKKKNSEMVYMFDSSTLNIDDYIRNLPDERSPYRGCYEFYAVSMSPDEYEINNGY